METAFKVVRLVGESSASIEEAAKVALRTSSERVHGQTWMEITDIRANVDDDGGIDRWQVAVDVAFRVEGA